jgi:hypothetical protein
MQPFLKRRRLAYTKRLLWKQNRAEPNEAEPGQAIQARKTITFQKNTWFYVVKLLFLWRVIVFLHKTNVFHENYDFVKGFIQSKERRVPNAERTWEYLVWIIKNSYFFFSK